jgi:hypothetical protein
MGENIKNLLQKELFFLPLFLGLTVQGQFHHGIELGANMTSADFNIGESIEQGSSFGYLIGYVAERDFSEDFYLRFGVNYNRREIKAEGRIGFETADEKWGVDLIEIPVNLGYYLNLNNRNFQFYIDAGLNIGFNSKAYVKNDEETIRLDVGGESGINRMSFGANLGGGLLIKKKLKFRLNYYYGLNSIATTDGDTWKNKTLALSVNYFLKEKLDD